ncbi:hypothetical protein ABTK35_20395, partial [Acinetobacter baumannii]
YNERYLDDSRAAIFKPEAEWTALDKWVNWRKQAVASDNEIVQYLRNTAEEKDRVDHNPDNVEKWKQYQALQAELKQFDK